jgi:hypothetical protein
MSDLHASPLEDEPQTPLWLPALGAALFVAVGLWWAVTPSAPSVASIHADQAPSPLASAAAAMSPPSPPQPQVPENAALVASARPVALPQPGSPAEERMKKIREQMNPRAPGGHR